MVFDNIAEAINNIFYPFNALFSNIVDFFTLLFLIVYCILFFAIQFYLLKFYGWVGVKFYQLYLVISDEDVIHFLQHPSVSYNNLKKKYEPVNTSQPTSVEPEKTSTENTPSNPN